MCVCERIRSHTCSSGIKPWRYGLLGPGKGSTHCMFQSRWCKRAIQSMESRAGKRGSCGMISMLKKLPSRGDRYLESRHGLPSLR